MTKKKKLKAWQLVAFYAVAIGAILWGLFAINPNWNLVQMFLGYGIVARIIYGVVGVSGLYWAIKRLI